MTQHHKLMLTKVTLMEEADCLYHFLYMFKVSLIASLEPGQKWLALVQDRLHIIQDGHEVGTFQSAQVNIGAGHGVQEVWETVLLGNIHTDRQHVVTCGDKTTG